MSQRPTSCDLAVFFVGFLALWVAAWLVALALGRSEATAYWAVAKVVVWVLYPLLRWRAPVPEQLACLGLRRRDLRRGLAWGAAVTAVWVGLSLAIAPVRGQHFAPAAVTFGALYTCLLTPACEEWLFRGYLQPALVGSGRRSWAANGLTSLLFLAPHLVGWSFTGVLAVNALSVYPLTLFALSLVLGSVRHRSGSLVASVLVHAGNNAVSSWWR
jgi:membrane protease YdiL (CAAX protease family)